MSALDDIKAGESAIAAAVTAAVGELQAIAAKLASSPSVSDSDAETIAGQLNTLATGLNAAVAAAASPPPTPPAG